MPSAPTAPQPPLSPAYAPEEITTIYRYDPDKAKALLDEAGWAVGGDAIRTKDGQRFAFDFTYEEDSTTLAQLVPYLQQCWKELGLEMNAVTMPFPAQQDQINKRDYDIALTAITLGTTGNQGIMYRSDATYPAGFNEVKYSNPEYDRLDDLQRRELDPEKRRAADRAIEHHRPRCADGPTRLRQWPGRQQPARPQLLPDRLLLQLVDPLGLGRRIALPHTRQMPDGCRRPETMCF
ncbi:MAG: ABC transporter substrate-binding protein [Thermomicrobiales bacterium]